MASYAAVISLIHVMENIEMYRLRYPKFLDEQKIQLQSLNENLIFLQDFLETYSSSQAAAGKDEILESRIADAAYAAEDIIEIYIVDYLHDIYDKTKGRNAAGNLYELFLAACCLKSGRMSSSHFSVEIQKVVEGMDFLLKEVMAIKESNQFQVQQQQLRDLVPAAPAASLSTNRKEAPVELFRDEMNQIVDKLTRGGQQPNLLTCSIVGMVRLLLLNLFMKIQVLCVVLIYVVGSLYLNNSNCGNFCWAFYVILKLLIVMKKVLMTINYEKSYTNIFLAVGI